MKAIIQIPCYNEEDSIAVCLSALPRELPGVDIVEWLIIDDGCTDRTVEVALSHGIDHVVRLHRRQGLAKAFMAGLEACLEAGADIIVNTDGDNQYRASDIPKLIQPILEGTADFVIGSRPIDSIEDFSKVKKYLQKMGSWVVRLASRTDIPDGPSGFRAMSRNVAMSLNVFDGYTYTIETIIQAGRGGWNIKFVPVHTNKSLRPSRLIKNIPHYILMAANTIVRIFMVYRPFRFFAIPGLLSFTLGVMIGFRFLYYYISKEGAGHVQSLILAALLMGIGFSLVLVGLLADLISVNRRLLEKVDLRISKVEEKIRNRDRKP
ncbi:MAG: glycosyltransferase family 2 protein [Nitrospiraceae bacterium]|nr:MAG: glycosyltransferase family 2 protein [Nitrospiraceae bacterium]